MRYFLLGVGVGAVGMGLYTGHIKVTITKVEHAGPIVTTTTPAS